MKRRIVLGSSAAVEILNEDINKMNRMKWEEGYPLLDPSNRSTNRFLHINEIVRKLHDNYRFRNSARDQRLYKWLDLLGTITGNKLDELFKDETRSKEVIGEIFPNLSDESIDEIATLYLIEEELNEKEKPHKSIELPPLEKKSNTKNVKIASTNVTSPNRSLIDIGFLSPK